jgi:hypothetical protein
MSRAKALIPCNVVVIQGMEGNATILAPAFKCKCVLCQLAYVAERVLLLDQQANELYKGFRSCASDGADQRVRVLVRMFRELLLSGKVLTRENANV